MGYWIVVVDDDVLSLKNAKELLGAEDMRVGCLRSGKALLEYMKKNTPDLILLDVLMPEMDGFETYQRLRQFEKEEERHETPVIFLTGENNSESESRGLKAGASDYIKKPFNRDILIRRIKNTVKNTRMIESLTEEATVDKLTGFFNKAAGTGKIEAFCKEEKGSLVVFDLDNFKLVNDMYGHDMGDRVLVAFAEIMRNNVRTEDVLSRIGGDEFMGFFPEMADEKGVDGLMKRLNEDFLKTAKALMGEDFAIPLGVSAGVVFVPEFSDDYPTLFRYADSELYKVKQNGKHGYSIYDGNSLIDKAEGDLDAELDRALHVMAERADGAVQDAMLLSSEAFAANYRFIMRFVKNNKGYVYSMLFSLSSKDGGPLFEDVTEKFGNVLQKCLLPSDILLQHKGNRFIAVLAGFEKRDIQGVAARVKQEWESTEYSDIAVIEYTSSQTDY